MTSYVANEIDGVELFNPLFPPKVIDDKQQRMPDDNLPTDLILEEHHAAVRESLQIIRDCQDNAFGNIVQIGKEFTKIKQHVKHGKFILWLKQVFPATARLAQYQMNVYRRLGEKVKVFSKLDPTAAYALAAPSTPDEAIAEVEQRIRTGEALNTTIVRNIIRKHKRPSEPQSSPRHNNLDEVTQRLLQSLKALHESMSEHLLDDLQAILGQQQAERLCQIRSEIEALMHQVNVKGKSAAVDSPTATHPTPTFVNEQNHSADYDRWLSEGPQRLASEL